ncbi:MAG: leucyl aminopeptidase [Actinobacteria bacterium]|uniref:leucyl aminopeptidase n=1 Tax=freshwater metagenome TaxID=449393 RepID=A0A6J7EET3_9ZZZZ|nr:leucyl aminopeptidase [Actinomycetota bacterium]
MTLTLAATTPASTACEALIVAIAPGRGKAIVLVSQGLTDAQSSRIIETLEAVGASAKSGDITRIPGGDGIKAALIVAVGLGDAAKQGDEEAVRRAYGNAIRTLSGRAKVAVVAPKDESQLRAIATGSRLAAYEFTSFKSKPSKAAQPPSSIVLLVPRAVSAAERRIVNEINVTADAINLTRDLVNTPPNALPPVALAKAATDAVAGLPVKVTIWDVPALKRARCGGILGVGQGSSNPPRLVKLEYSPRGATAHLSLVGKGITFDTGGISIKPAANMDEMKGDMAGAAAVIGALQSIATLGLKIKVTGWLAIAENMPSSTAQRPGDVITMFDGTTVEVLNTDAEGRLVLADALGMAVKEKPDLLIDVATLTGAQSVALGRRTSGVMSNDDDARDQVCAAAAAAGEDMWPMPLPEDLRSALDSATADIANIGDRMGGMLSAGVFLSTFIPAGQPWVHLDIAGPAFNDKGAYGYLPKGGTGAAVRTFVRIAQTLAAG